MPNTKISNNDGSITSGENISFWLDSVMPLEFETLSASTQADVLIIGGGIAGLTTAYLLLKSGRQVTLVEDGLIGSGESGRTTAHLTCALDDRYFEIETAFGEEGARKAAESHTAAIELIERIVKEENINCEFQRVDGYLFVHPTDTKENLEKEFDATQKAGLQTVWLDRVPHLSSENGPCILFPAQGQFHIMRYLHGLAHAIARMGGKIFTKTRARHINDKGAECNCCEVRASQIVVATNTPVNDFAAMHTKQFPYRTYVIGATVPRGSLPHALWWDTGDQDSKWVTSPYHYIRLQHIDEENELLIIGGEDHKTGQADDEGIPEEERYNALMEWSKKRFPMIKEIVYRWSGQVMEPVDYMAYIGKNPGDDNVYIITGDSGNGMTHGTLGGLIVTDLIQGKENKWADLYSPKRIPLKAPGTYLSEVFNMAKQYGDFLKGADINELNELGPGDGAILSKGLQKLAVYKDENEIVHAFSAVCPHMGCMVQWNGEEKSFDCPCHGSRFTKEGEVINGPATVGLEKIEIKK
jgi:glycine/D-amino acid oxidase-like deaminating enzyme/nitrite reductase/ring-hydroxylating ferredoxin subunit